jgi:hypothetical protein
MGFEKHRNQMIAQAVGICATTVVRWRCQNGAEVMLQTSKCPTNPCPRRYPPACRLSCAMGFDDFLLWRRPGARSVRDRWFTDGEAVISAEGREFPEDPRSSLRMLPVESLSALAGFPRKAGEGWHENGLRYTEPLWLTVAQIVHDTPSLSSRTAADPL